jgi:hypothetical protein
MWTTTDFSLLPSAFYWSELWIWVLCYDRWSVGQSVLVSSLRLDFYYCQTVTCLLIWGALSNERMGLSFTIAAGPHQCSPSRVRVQWDSRPCFTASDSRLYFSSPPTTRRATVEVLDPTSSYIAYPYPTHNDGLVSNNPSSWKHICRLVP